MSTRPSPSGDDIFTRAPSWRRYIRFWGARVDEDVDDELAFHVEMRIRDYIARGLTERDARAAALGRLGNVPSTRAACLTIGHRRQRRMTRARTIDAFVQDARYAFRTLARQLGWTTIAVVTLAVGIGATTAVFGVVNSLILSPLPYRDAGGVFLAWRIDPKSSIMITPSAKVIEAWEKQSRSIDAIEPYQSADMTMTGRGDATEVHIAAVRSQFFKFTGVNALRGRSFLPEESRAGAPHVAMISEQLWRTRFGGKEDVVGQKLFLNEKPFTIVGVAPARLRLPAFNQISTDAWLSLGPDSVGGGQQAMLRLKASTTPEAAAKEMDAIIDRAGLREKGLRTYGVKLTKPGDMVGFKASLYLLSGAVGLLLLVACANVAHLLLARGATRERELAIRVALGAGRARLGRQLLTESLLLAVIGCVAGVVVGFIAIRALLSLRPPTMTQLALAQLDGRALGVALGVSVLTGIIFGCTAAIHAIRRTTSDSLRATSLAGTATKSRHRLRSFLVVTEMALSALLLVGAALVVRSVIKLQGSDTGFETHDLYSMTFVLPDNRYASDAQRAAFAKSVLERTRSISGITSATIAAAAPPSVGGFMMTDVQGDKAAPSGVQGFLAFTRVPRDFFSVLGIPLRGGTGFTAGAETRNEVMINEGLAKKLWPGESAVGHRIHLGAPGDTSGWSTIVGVAGNVPTLGLARDRDEPLLYLPLESKEWPHDMTLVARVRPGVDPTAALRPIVPALDPRLTPPPVRTIAAGLAETIASQRFTMTLLAVFASLAVVLSAIGLYGVISYVVTQRSREIGIRIALGATPRHVARAVVAPGLVLSTLGLALGLVAAVWGTKLIQSSLFGVTGTDPISYAAAGGVLLGISLLACLVPMRRAMAVDPVIAMRGD